MSNITIVTAFFDIGRGDILDDYPSYLKRTTDTYFNYFAKLATLENDMVIFTSVKFKDKILALRQGKKTTVIEFDFHHKLRYIKKQIANIQNSPDFIAKVNPNQINNIKYWSADYVLLNNLKTYFVNKAIKLNLVNDSQIAWVDFGYVRDDDTLGKVTRWQYDFDADKVHLFSIVKGFVPDTSDKVLSFIFNNQVFLIGGCMVATQEKWQEFLSVLYHNQKNLLRQNIIDDDQGLYVMSLYTHPNLFQINYLGKNKWFDLFKKYDKNHSLLLKDNSINDFDDYTLVLHKLIQKLDSKAPKVNKLDKWQKKPYKPFFRLFVSKPIRKTWQKNADKYQQAHLFSCFDELIQLYHDGALTQFDIKAKKQLPQNIIWQYWGQGIDDSLPDIVKLCFNLVDKHKADATVIRLDDSNVHDYLDLPDFVWQKRQNPAFKHAFFADLLRVALLSVYGGTWIDATVLLTAPIDDRLKNEPFFMFQRDKNAINQDFWQRFNADYFSWDNTHHVNVLNSFIIAKKGNQVISDCLQLLLNFWQNQSTVTHYFFFQILFDALIKQYPQNNCTIIDDTLPHLLHSNLHTLSNQEYHSLLNTINIHKLTYLNHKGMTKLTHLMTTNL